MLTPCWTRNIPACGLRGDVRKLIRTHIPPRPQQTQQRCCERQTESLTSLGAGRMGKKVPCGLGPMRFPQQQEWRRFRRGMHSLCISSRHYGHAVRRVTRGHFRRCSKCAPCTWPRRSLRPLQHVLPQLLPTTPASTNRPDPHEGLLPKQRFFPTAGCIGIKLGRTPPGMTDQGLIAGDA